MKTALVFPATTVDAVRFSERDRAAGWRVVGAASVSPMGAEVYFDDWVYLPFVHEESFLKAFTEVIEREQVTKIFSSHEVVRRFLCEILPNLCAGVELEPLEHYGWDNGFLQRVEDSFAGYRALAFDFDVEETLSEVEHRAVLTKAFEIRGESGVLKLSAIMAAVGSGPKGDIVEIGVLSGRSAFVLGWLARRYDVGAILCIDPWSTEAAMQSDAPSLLRRASAQVDFETLFHEFCLNLLPSFYGNFNYVREAARNVRVHYRRGLEVGPTVFGRTQYTGEIALLHIDGNHDLSAVSQDIDLWWRMVVPLGWIIVDDYVWPFGDGPQRAADDLLTRNPRAFKRAFVHDGALFLQRADRASC